MGGGGCSLSSHTAGQDSPTKQKVLRKSLPNGIRAGFVPQACAQIYEVACLGYEVRWPFKEVTEPH